MEGERTLYPILSTALLLSHASPMTTPDDNSSTTTRRLRYAILAVAVAFAVLVVLFFTVLRPKQAVTTVNSVSLDGVNFGFDPHTVGLAFNVTVLLDLSVHNPNRASFHFREGHSYIFYAGSLVGEASTPPGHIRAHGTVATIAKLVVMAGRLVSEGNSLSDAVLNNSLEFTTHTRIPGKAKVLGLFKVRMVMHTTCEIRIRFVAWKVNSFHCQSKAKF